MLTADPAARGLQRCVHAVTLDSRCTGSGAFPASPIKEAEISEMLLVGDPHCLAAQAQLSWAQHKTGSRSRQVSAGPVRA